MKRAIFAGICLTLSACVAIGPKTPIAEAPTCSTEADCSMKWAAARTFVLEHAGYKIQTYSPDFLQTFSPGEYDADLAAEVNKEPIPGGGYRIVAKFWCNNLFGCNPNQWTTLDAFNRYVASVGGSLPNTAQSR